MAKTQTNTKNKGKVFYCLMEGGGGWEWDEQQMKCYCLEGLFRHWNS